MKKILICEDESDVQESMANILIKRKYAVYAAKDGEEAINQARKIDPALILLDIRMPKFDGLEVAKQIREFNLKTKIIFITAFQSPELTKEAAKYDILDYIVKPTTSQEILNVVNAALLSS